MLSGIQMMLERLIGPDDGSFELDVWQMMLRALLVFLIAVVLARVGSRRFMGRNTAFDLILGIMLGSVLSRAITGNSPFFQTLAAAAVLVAMHKAVAWLAFRLQWFGTFSKGEAILLVRDGKVVEEGLKRSLLGERDLLEALRIHGGYSAVEDVKEAYLERNGNISVKRLG